MRRIRLLLAALAALSLVAAATASLSAGARGNGGLSGGLKVVLCTGTALVTVTLDANGRPVKRRQVCPDFAAHVADTAAPMPAPRFLPVRAVERRAWGRAEPPARTPRRAHPVRAPPVRG